LPAADDGVMNSSLPFVELYSSARRESTDTLGKQ
jgi:hypothetical protein